VLGPGDDCALVDSGKRGLLEVLKTDCLVEEIHFARRTPPELVGWKAMARPLSDFAAMSAVPQFALVTLIVPSDRTVAWVRGLYCGLEKAARAFDVSVVGGETSDIKGPVVISITVAGFVEKKRWVGRTGGKPSDDLFVTGRLGGSLGGRHLKFTPRITEARWLTKYFRVHAMMDLSDGLGVDLPRLARASKVGFKIDPESLPLNAGCTIEDAISNGEDYELLFALASRDRKRLEDSWKKKFPKLLLSRIGKLNSAFGIRHSAFPKGYVHFQKR
jgi:thiamine-monophosphate kinase